MSPEFRRATRIAVWVGLLVSVTAALAQTPRAWVDPPDDLLSKSAPDKTPSIPVSPPSEPEEAQTGDDPSSTSTAGPSRMGGSTAPELPPAVQPSLQTSHLLPPATRRGQQRRGTLRSTILNDGQRRTRWRWLRPRPSMERQSYFTGSAGASHRYWRKSAALRNAGRIEPIAIAGRQPRWPARLLWRNVRSGLSLTSPPLIPSATANLVELENTSLSSAS